MKKIFNLLIISLTIVSFNFCSNGGDNNEKNNSANLSTLPNYVILNVDGGNTIKVESKMASWGDDKITGTTDNYYPKEKFRLEFIDLSSRITNGVESLNGQEFPVVITHNEQDYNTIVTINKSEKGKGSDILGTEYFLKGNIKAFDMGNQKVSGGDFSFSTFVKE